MSSATTSRNDSSVASGSSRASRLAPFVVFFVVAVSVIGWHMHKYPYLSPIDENTQFDYIRVLPHIPSGTMDQDSLRMTACRQYPPDLFDQGLGHLQLATLQEQALRPQGLPGGGKSTAGSTAPFYYVVTAALTRPIAYVVDIPLLLLIRAASALWLTALMTVSYLIARQLQVSRAAAMGAAILTATASDTLTSAASSGRTQRPP